MTDHLVTDAEAARMLTDSLWSAASTDVQRLLGVRSALMESLEEAQEWLLNPLSDATATKVAALLAELHGEES
jgi:hypothetical protein